MPQYWMISDRSLAGGKLGADIGSLTYGVSDGGPLNNMASWRQVAHDPFQTLLAGAADAFPVVPPGSNADQKHVCFFIHGYNEGFEDAATKYQGLCQRLFDGPRSEERRGGK